MTPRARADRILVVGGYGYRNVGDEAMLAGLLTTLGHDGVTVISRSPAETTRMHGVATAGRRGAPAALRDSGTLLIGGGGLFGRDMGLLGRLLPVAGLGAVALGRRVVIAGIDLDDELSPSARLFVPRLLRRATRVAVRDERSVEIARGWGVKARLVADLSHAMAPAPPATGIDLIERAGVDLRRPTVGLCLAAVRPELWNATRLAVERAMDERPDVEFCFIPMSRHPSVPSHDDLRPALELRESRPRLRILEEVAHPAAILSAFGALNAVVGMRYHSMLFAERAGTSLVAIPYAEKNRRWLSERGRAAVEPTPGALVAALRQALEPRMRNLEPMRAAS